MIRTFLICAILSFSSLTEASQNVVVVLDDSGSMDERMRSDRSITKMDAAKTALAAVVNNLSNDTKIGVVLLNRGWLYPLSTIDKGKLSQLIPEIYASGGTPLGKYLKIGADALLDLRSKEHYGSYRLLVITDGEADPFEGLVDKYIPDILSRGIVVDAIGVDMDQTHSLATKVHSYRKADDPDSLKEAISAVFAETTAGNSSEESDFEIIAPLPNELAGAVLVALSETGNHHIGTVVKVDDSGNVVFENVPDDGMSTLSIVFLIFGFIIAALLILRGCVIAVVGFTTRRR